MTFKLPGVEFLQEEFDALAAEVGKLAEEVEFEIVDHVENGVPGRLLRRVEAALGFMQTAVVPEHWDAHGEPLPGNPLLDQPADTTEHKDVYQ